MFKSRSKVERLVLSKVTSTTDKAKNLLSEWHRFRDSGACAFFFDIQESKDRLELLSARLSTEIYCAEPANVDELCDRFEIELERLKERVYKDLVVGLKRSATK